MKHSGRDDVVCFLCDYAGLLFVAFVVLVILSLTPLWYSLLLDKRTGTQAASTTTAPVITNSVIAPYKSTTPSPFISSETPQPELSPTEAFHDDLPLEETSSADVGGWILYEDAVLNFSIEYPVSWYAIPQREQSGEGNNRVLFSDAPGNTSLQVRTGEETARVWITSYQRGDQPQAQWIVNRFNWIPGELVPATVDGLPAHTARYILPDNQDWSNQVIWIDRGTETLAIWIQVRADQTGIENLIQEIVATVQIIQS